MCFRDGLLSNNIRGCLWGQGTFYKKNCDIINRASLVAQLAKPPAMQETLCWKRHRLPTPVFLGFPGGFAGEESACNVRHLGLFPGLGRFPGEGNCYPLQYCGLENSMDCIVYGVAKNWTRLNLYYNVTNYLSVNVLYHNIGKVECMFSHIHTFIGEL